MASDDQSINPTDLRQSTRQLREVFDAMPEGIVVFDLEGQIVFSNRTAETLSGLASGTMRGRRFDDPGWTTTLPDGSPVRPEEMPFTRALATGKPVQDVHLVSRGPDGNTRDYRVMAAPLHSSGGDLLGAVCSFVDITDQVRLEAAERISDSRFRRLFESNVVGVLIARLDGAIVDANDNFLKLIGYTREELRSGTIRWPDLTPSEYAPIDAAKVEELRSTGELIPFEKEFLHKDGHRIPILLGGAMLEPRAAGEVVVLAIDLTRLREAQERGRVATERLAFLSDVSAALAGSLDYEVTLSTLARLAVPAIADWCAIYLAAVDGSIQRVVVVHPDPAKVDLAIRLQERYPTDPNAETGVPKVIRTGEPEFVPEITEEMVRALVPDAELRDILLGLRLSSAISVPLVARGRNLGAIQFVTAESGRLYTSEDLEVAVELGRRAGMAVDNARLFRDAAEREESLRFLNDVNDVMASSLDYVANLRAVVRLAAAEFGGYCIAYLKEPDGSLRRVASAHEDVDQQYLLDRMFAQPLTQAADDPIRRAAETGEPLLVTRSDPQQVAAYAPTPEAAAIYRSLNPTSAMVVPLTSRRLVLGAMAFARTGSSPGFTSQDLEPARLLAQRAGVNIDKARLLENSLAAQRRLAFVAEASSVLGASLDYGETIAAVAKLMIPTLADSCVIYEFDSPDDARRIAFASTTPEREATLRGLGPALRRADGHPVFAAGDSREPFVENDARPEFWRGIASSAEQAEVYSVLELRSLAVLPLIARDHVFGAISLARVRPDGYDADDVALAREVARRCASAIDDAQLFRQASERQERLEFIAQVGDALAGSLDYQTTIDRVARLVVPRLGDFAFIYRLHGDRLERAAFAHRDPEGEALLRELQAFPVEAAREEAPFVAVAHTGRPMIVHETSEAVLRAASTTPRQLEIFRQLGFASALVAPLIANGRVIGVLDIVSRVPGRYTAEDLDLAEDVAYRAALAIDNALLYQESQAEQERRQFLADVGSTLAASLEIDQTLTTLASLAVPRLADWAIVFLVQPDGSLKRVTEVAAADIPPDVVQRIREGYPSGPRGESTVSRAIATGEPAVMSEMDETRFGEWAVDAEHRELMRRVGPRSAMAVPLLARGATMGVLNLLSRQPHRFSDADLPLAGELGRRAGLAIENAQLYQDARVAEERVRFLAEASAALASSLEYEKTLGEVARLCVEHLADWCLVYEGAGEEVRLLTSAARDPAIPLPWRSNGRLPDPVRAAIESKAPQAIAPDGNGGGPDGPSLVLPVVSQARSLGAIALGRTAGGGAFEPEEVVLTEDLAHRVAAAVDNAHLFRASQEAQEELRRAAEAKDEFLGMMSHELRTPITSLFGGSKILRARGDRLDATARDELMHDIEVESERLYRIVEDLLTLSRVELGQKVETQPVLLQRAAEKLIAEFERKGSSRPYVRELPEDLPPVRGEPTYIEQVLRNLLSNAEKYSPDLRTPIEVRVRRDGEDRIALSVLDSGTGLSAGEAEKIFDRFYRSSRTSRTTRGVGMGLTVCRRLVEAQSGTIWANPRPEGGLEVTFSLPADIEPLPLAE